MANEILSLIISNFISTFLRTGYPTESFAFSSIPFIRMGQIALFIKKCNIPGIVFDHIWGKYANDANTVDTSDTNTLSDKKRKTHYWMYTVFDDNSWLECQEKGVMVLGMEFRKHPIRQ